MGANLMLSEQDRLFLASPYLLQRKNELLLGVEQVLHQCLAHYRQALTDVDFVQRWPAIWQTPKISKGEQLEGLPWRMLDFPRSFHGPDIIAVRTLFWWGRGFVFQAHIHGKEWQQKQAILLQHLPKLPVGALWLNQDDPWQQQWTHSNYLPLATLQQEELKQIALQRPYFKWVYPIPITTNWETLPVQMATLFQQYLNWMMAH